jgi:hypothetical protein
VLTCHSSSADLDPIYLCSELHLCPLNKCNGTCTVITNAFTSPPTGLAGTTFNVQVDLHVNKPTGTGVTRVLVIPPPPGQEFGTFLVEQIFQKKTLISI